MSEPLSHPALTAETLSVSIKRPPDLVWDIASDVSLWPKFTRFLLAATLSSSQEYRLTTRLGSAVLRTHFDRDELPLDHVLIVPIRSTLVHACRLVPNYYGCELVLTCVSRPREFRDDFERRVGHMRACVERLRYLVEGPAT
ncbi:MAG: hypothetical protein ACRDJ9_21745 [Dehalococcoidia bacterium]